MLTVVAGGTPVPAQESSLLPAPSYYRPVVVDGFTFPVARSNWLSVIEMEEDWHDPRFRLIDGRWQLVGVHEGNDVVAEEGTPILSATSGMVEAVGWTFYSGTRVGVRGQNGKYYFYAHLSQVGVSVGTPVEVGEVLGKVGNTGYGPPGREDRFPPHLHFGIEGPGGWENPFPQLMEAYRASVAATARGERHLSALARKGDRQAWERQARALYVELG